MGCGHSKESSTSLKPEEQILRHVAQSKAAGSSSVFFCRTGFLCGRVSFAPQMEGGTLRLAKLVQIDTRMQVCVSPRQQTSALSVDGSQRGAQGGEREDAARQAARPRRKCDEMCLPVSFSTLGLQSRHTANQKIHVSKIFNGVKIEGEDGEQEKKVRLSVAQ